MIFLGTGVSVCWQIQRSIQQWFEKICVPFLLFLLWLSGKACFLSFLPCKWIMNLELFSWCFALLKDELLWGAAWLHKATRNPVFLNYIQVNGQTLGADDSDNTFGWDNKHVGARILLSKVTFSSHDSHQIFSSFFFLFLINIQSCLFFLV